ncbi:MAG: hypothetical protein IJC81_02315 [Clostridia bacterium]|nr:hypothetical protein [Clostridia bacterium]
MKLYINENEKAKSPSVAVDDMFLTKDMPTTAGSKMLDGYMSLFNAQVVDSLESAGYSISGKCNVGEFGIDLIGETSYFDGEVKSAAAEVLATTDAEAALCFDVNGAPRRAAALNDLVFVKPTYGTVSRFGTVSAVCSGETVGVMARDTATAAKILGVVAGHDDKDGTSLCAADCEKVKASGNATLKKIAVIKALTKDADTAKLDAAIKALGANGVVVEEVDGDILTAAKEAWNVLMCAELCNNVSRYDGIKYGYRTKNYKTIDELYVNSRTEAFGELLKTAILYGSDVLAGDNYENVYVKALKVRRVICEYFASLFANYDAVIMPACAKAEYTAADVENNIALSFDEALYTAPASISGLPAVVAGGVQVVSKAFGEDILFTVAKILEKEGK